MARVNTIVWDNGAGLSRDADIVESILAGAGHQVRRRHLGTPPVLERLRHGLGGRPPYDLNLFFQNIVSAWLPLARGNVLLPNPEHLGLEDHGLLARLDATFAKTRSGDEVMRGLGARSRFVGFTAVDRGGVSADAQPAAAGEVSALHVAGRSRQKGTLAVLSLWLRHPEWPLLTIVARPECGVTRPASLPPNVRFEDQRLDDATLGTMQRAHAIHLCPSETEGFGHTIAEGLSCGALVVTLDAPPMNELVTPEVGMLAGWTQTTSMAAATRYAPDAAQLEAAVERAMSFPASVRRDIGSAARGRFLALDREFRKRFVTATAEVLENRGSEDR